MLYCTTKHFSSPAAHKDIAYIFDVVREVLKYKNFNFESLIREDLEANKETRLIYKV